MTGKPIDAEDIAVLLRLQAALPDVGLNGWFEGVQVLARVIEHLTAAQQGQAAELAPPSAPVGVKTLSEFMAEQEALHPGIHDKVQAATDELRASLAQQPAGGQRSTHGVWRKGEWLPCYCAADSDHGIGNEQPATVDRARFRKAPCYLCGYNGPGYFQPETHPCAALYHAAQHQEPTT